VDEVESLDVDIVTLPALRVSPLDEASSAAGN
jgi:hypothetical protein